MPAEPHKLPMSEEERQPLIFKQEWIILGYQGVDKCYYTTKEEAKEAAIVKQWGNEHIQQVLTKGITLEQIQKGLKQIQQQRVDRAIYNMALRGITTVDQMIQYVQQAKRTG